MTLFFQEDSWADVDFWVRELGHYLPRELDDGMPVLFVGNKKDLVDRRKEEQKVVNFRQVAILTTASSYILDYCTLYSQVQEVANAYGYLPPIEVSAKTGQGVDKAFLRVVKHLLKQNKVNTKNHGGPIIPDPHKSGCCSIV